MSEVDTDTRTLDQNAAQWPILKCWADQHPWIVNGKRTMLTPGEWKDILTAAFRQETVRLAPGLHGGMVMLGSRTSKFSKKEFAEYLTWLNAESFHRGIKIPYREAA